MNTMVTICPNCRQQLAVTPADLRVGQGYVRCGRCQKVFNALLTLSEDTPPPEEPSAVAHGTRSLPALDTGSMRALEEQEPLPPLPEHVEMSPFGPIDDDVEVVQTLSSGKFRRIGTANARMPDDEDADESDLQLPRDLVIESSGQAIDFVLKERHSEVAPPPPAPEDFDVDAAFGKPRTGWGWYAGGALLLLLLLGQLVHHNRHSLVAMPGLDGAIRGIYGLLGENVEPSWDIAQYSVISLGGMELRGGARTVVLRAAVAVSKDAPRGQPPPLIRAELSDRWGNVLARNDLLPRDWLLGDAPARIQPGERLDAQLSMPAPDRVNSFVLAACLPDQHGELQCAVPQ